MHARERRKREALSEDSRRVAHEMADGREEPKSAVAVDEALWQRKKDRLETRQCSPRKMHEEQERKAKGEKREAY
ncbi:hypothetical protein M431DRAFT_512379 [Trichoderma harzianum CBS 226.95]|uniref:Uncharacterized protein n=1 Tax=Trichoderma harzianum CBS 226.95 TaxID=983964 RepID=A0A2T3ZZB8_TRIHA|nr:hypothetical protein M431DRAFT_512379 [Trichoderma harzianum CBS 226.95]PTB50162.1 hypothetical protein M431DRAFT_512379 [Trichoderma harzianum CBS 226.95]